MKLYAFLNNSVQKDIQESIGRMIPCGYANGYVAIPKEHPFYGQDYDFINKFVAVHGGLTFSEPMRDVLKDFDKTNVRGINCDFEDIPTDYWVVGFDTLHCGDDERLDAIWCTNETIRMMYQLKEKAGYEWDDEKQELKRIEQRPTQETDPFEPEHGKYYYCIKDYFCDGKKQASKGDVIQGLPIMNLKDVSEYFLPVNSIKQKPTWNREDEQNLNVVLSYINDECLRRWLKDAIYNKYERHTEREWSQEDSYMLRQAIRCVNNSGKLEVSTEEIEYWLKSLKQRIGE